ncbi:GNAT family N-acetyltransferase [bacterium]|nr:GNAT family N-acetyltransferase [candidate division CSSED10-310 bacterium]
MNLAELAIESERILFGRVNFPRVPSKTKTLLVKTMTGQGRGCEPMLHEIRTDHDWDLYTQCRGPVERELGLSGREIEALIRIMRNKGNMLNITWYLYPDGERPAGAVGLLRYEAAGLRCGRLQDVDIFPGRRGQGLGNCLLEAVECLAMRGRLKYLTVGAQSDSWTCDWYERRGYEPVLSMAVPREPGR